MHQRVRTNTANCQGYSVLTDFPILLPQTCAPHWEPTSRGWNTKERVSLSRQDGWSCFLCHTCLPEHSLANLFLHLHALCLQSQGAWCQAALTKHLGSPPAPSPGWKQGPSSLVKSRLLRQMWE